MTRFETMTLAVVAGLLFAVACGEDDGETPKCDELPLYGYDKIQDPANLAARQAAAAKGCVTMASDGVGSGTGGAGTGGTAGAGGGAGAGGSAGSAQDAGGD